MLCTTIRPLMRTQASQPNNLSVDCPLHILHLNIKFLTYTFFGDPFKP